MRGRLSTWLPNTEDVGISVLGSDTPIVSRKQIAYSARGLIDHHVAWVQSSTA
jgi:hypothetical protein